MAVAVFAAAVSSSLGGGGGSCGETVTESESTAVGRAVTPGGCTEHAVYHHASCRGDDCHCRASWTGGGGARRGHGHK